MFKRLRTFLRMRFCRLCWDIRGGSIRLFFLLVFRLLLLKFSFCPGYIIHGSIQPLLPLFSDLVQRFVGCGFYAAGQLIGGIFISGTFRSIDAMLTLLFHTDIWL